MIKAKVSVPDRHHAIRIRASVFDQHHLLKVKPNVPVIKIKTRTSR